MSTHFGTNPFVEGSPTWFDEVHELLFTMGEQIGPL